MATQAQIDANRANAQKSTGPRTPEGKARSRQNALRHGLQGQALLINSEDETEFNELVDDLLEEWQPATTTEEIVFYKMVEQYWLSRRGALLLADHTEFNDGDDDSKQVALMLRYNTGAERGFYRALHELERLQKNRRQTQPNQPSEAQIGFVPKNAPQNAPHPEPEPVQNPAPVLPTPIWTSKTGSIPPNLAA